MDGGVGMTHQHPTRGSFERLRRSCARGQGKGGGQIEPQAYCVHAGARGSLVGLEQPAALSSP